MLVRCHCTPGLRKVGTGKNRLRRAIQILRQIIRDGSKFVVRHEQLRWHGSDEDLPLRDNASTKTMNQNQRDVASAIIDGEQVRERASQRGSQARHSLSIALVTSDALPVERRQPLRHRCVPGRGEFGCQRQKNAGGQQSWRHFSATPTMNETVQ